MTKCDFSVGIAFWLFFDHFERFFPSNFFPKKYFFFNFAFLKKIIQKSKVYSLHKWKRPKVEFGKASSMF